MIASQNWISHLCMVTQNQNCNLLELEDGKTHVHNFDGLVKNE